MKFARRSGFIVSSFALATAGIFFTGADANAAATCNQGEVCLYQNANFTGSVYKVPNGCDLNFANRTFNNGNPLNDQVSSVINNKSDVRIMYSDANRGGASLAISPGDRYANLTSVVILGKTVHFNDIMSSIC